VFSKWFSGKKREESFAVKSQNSHFSAADYCEQGQKMLDSGKLMTAMDFFQAAIEADRYFEKAYFFLAEVYQKQGKTDKAKSTLYALLAVNPENNKALGKIDELKGEQVIIKTPTSQKPVKPKSIGLSTKPSKTKQKTKVGAISFKVTKCFWILLCFSEFVLSIEIAIGIGAFDGSSELGVTVVLSIYFSFLVYKVFYM